MAQMIVQEKIDVQVKTVPNKERNALDMFLSWITTPPPPLLN